MWQTHYSANLLAATTKASWPWRALLHSVYDQPDGASVHAQVDRVLDALADKLIRVAEHLEQARPTCWRSPPSPRSCGGRSGPDRGAVIRLVGAVLAEQHDERAKGRRYLGLDVLTHGRLRPVTDTGEEVTTTNDIPAVSA